MKILSLGTMLPWGVRKSKKIDHGSGGLKKNHQPSLEELDCHHLKQEGEHYWGGRFWWLGSWVSD